jgi:hypothetical protein
VSDALDQLPRQEPWPLPGGRSAASYSNLCSISYRHAGVGRARLLPADRGAARPVRGAAGVDLATVREVAANVEPYIRADGTKVIWSLMQLERQLRPGAFGRRRGGYIDRRRTPAADT